MCVQRIAVLYQDSKSCLQFEQHSSPFVHTRWKNFAVFEIASRCMLFKVFASVVWKRVIDTCQPVTGFDCAITWNARWLKAFSLETLHSSPLLAMESSGNRHKKFYSSSSIWTDFSMEFLCRFFWPTRWPQTWWNRGDRRNQTGLAVQQMIESDHRLSALSRVSLKVKAFWSVR